MFRKFSLHFFFALFLCCSTVQLVEVIVVAYVLMFLYLSCYFVYVWFKDNKSCRMILDMINCIGDL